MKKLTIGHVNLARGFRGGERQTELLISELAKLGHSQYLLCRKSSKLASDLSQTTNLKVIEVDRFLDIRLNGHGALKSCDIIQAHEARAAQWAYLHHLLYKTPFVLTRRVPEAVRTSFLNRRIYSSASAAVSISQSIARYLEQTFKIESPVIPSACAHFHLNEKFVSELHEKFRDKFVVGHVGALVDKHKGQTVLIDAARRLCRDIPNLLILFVGSGPDLSVLQEKGKDIKDHLAFTGFVNNVADYIHAMDVFAYPSNYEGLGSVLLDVMEQGVPIVATAVDGIPDIIKDKKTGLLINQGDSLALAKAILLIKNDRQLRSKLIDGGQREAQAHSPENMAASYQELYNRILGA